MFFNTTLIKYSSVSSKRKKMDIHSPKYTRFVRSAKLANCASSLKSFTFFAPKTNPSSTLSLLFLNQGLSSKELLLLRFGLNKLGISLTHLPTRFWSKSFLFSEKTVAFKKAINGNMFCLHTNNLTHNPIYSIFQFLHHKQPISNQEISSLVNNFQPASRLFLPWDFMTTQTNVDSSINTWFNAEHNHVNLLIHHMDLGRITFAGLISVSNKENNLIFHLRKKTWHEYTSKALSNFEPFYISCFSRLFLLGL